jgi:hypothetical protein
LPHARRRQARHARVTQAGEDPRRHPPGAIYGTIVASAAIATTAGGHESAALVLEATLATYWSSGSPTCTPDFLGHGLGHARADPMLLASILVQELSMLVAPALSSLFLLLGALGMLEEALAVGLALWNGVVQLVGWGIDVGRKRGQAWPAALLTGLVYGAFGVVIVLLEVQLH